MHLQVLSSGSEGNATLVRAGETSVLVDAGLGPRKLAERLDAARVGPRQLDHVLVTHAHLDHSRSAGVVAKRQQATLHATSALLRHAKIARAPRLSTVPVGGRFELAPRRGSDSPVEVRAVPLPHDCDPTVAYRLEHDGRVAVILTDMGRPCRQVARALSGAHLLMLEFNHCLELMEQGPYPFVLRRRITGDRGHLSNPQGAEMLLSLAGEQLETLVLAHLSAKTNVPERALDAARGALARLGLDHVAVHVASQHEVGPNLPV